MERKYYTINEETARTAQNINSFRDYTTGSATSAYQNRVNEIYDIVKHSGNITLDQVIKVAKILRERSYANKLSGTVKEVLGTCQ